MSNGRPDDASAPETAADIALLEAEMADFLRRKQECETQVRRLRGEEDMAAGRFFAKEIFELQRDKMRLDVEAELRRKRINRLRLGDDLMFK